MKKPGPRISMKIYIFAIAANNQNYKLLICILGRQRLCVQLQESDREKRKLSTQASYLPRFNTYKMLSPRTFFQALSSIFASLRYFPDLLVLKVDPLIFQSRCIINSKCTIVHESAIISNMAVMSDWENMIWRLWSQEPRTITIEIKERK